MQGMAVIGKWYIGTVIPHHNSSDLAINTVSQNGVPQTNPFALKTS